MKKWVLIMAVSAVPLVTPAQQKEALPVSFSITGKLGNVPEESRIYLVYRSNNAFVLDSATVAGNSFVMHGSAPAAQKAFLFLSQHGGRISFNATADQVAVYLEAGTVEVDSPDSLKHARVGGTPLNRDQQDYINAAGNIRGLQEGIKRAYMATADAAKRDSLEGDYRQLDVLLQTSLSGFIQSHPNSSVALNILRANFNPTDNVQLAAELFNSLSADIRKTDAALAYQRSIDNVYKLAPGKPAPDFAARDMAGAEKHLSDFKGKYVLLDFWASWCGPCRRESASLVASYSRFKSKSFEILSFSVDQNAEEWKKAVEQDHYTWANVREHEGDPEPVAKLYSITAIPANFLLDPSGNIVAMNLRGKELETKLAELLNK